MNTPAAMSRDARVFWTLFVAAAVVRAAMMPYGGFPTDIATFKAWAAAMAEKGPAGFYGGGFADYLPGYMYVLWLIGELHAAVRFSDQALLFVLKMPAAAADLLGTVLLWRLAARFVGARPALVIAIGYLFHPALIFVGAYWGQSDSVGATLALAAVALLLRRHPLAWAVGAAAFLVKPQTAPVLAVMGVAVARRAFFPTEPSESRPRPGAVVAALFTMTATLTLLDAPFRVGPRELVTLMRNAVGVYPYGSVVAFNLWGAVQGFWQSDAARLAGLPLYVWGLLATTGGITMVLAAVWRRPADGTIVVGATAALVVTFLLPTRIHERYLIPALPFLALGPVLDRRLWGPYVWLSVLLLLNLVYAYTRPYVQTFVLPTGLEHSLFSGPATRVLSLAALSALPWLLWILNSFQNELRKAPGEPAP